jgi:hypothetical protein
LKLSKPTGRCSNGLLMIDYIGKLRYSWFTVSLSGNAAAFQTVFDLKWHNVLWFLCLDLHNNAKHQENPTHRWWAL